MTPTLVVLAGHWCEDGEKGSSNCHNDNGFHIALSANLSQPWGAYNDGFVATDTCNRLHDGCGWRFPPVLARYVKLAVISSCVCAAGL